MAQGTPFDTAGQSILALATGPTVKAIALFALVAGFIEMALGGHHRLGSILLAIGGVALAPQIYQWLWGGTAV